MDSSGSDDPALFEDAAGSVFPYLVVFNNLTNYASNNQFVHHVLLIDSTFPGHHALGTRLGKFGADAFTIMKLMGHSSITVSRWYVHPSPETIELAFERLTLIGKHEFPRS